MAADGPRAYREEVDEGVLLHRALPDLRRLYVEPTTRCDRECAICVRRTWGETEGDLPLAIFREVVAQTAKLPDLGWVFLGGVGEPLLHPAVLDMIALAKQAGLRVGLTTNGDLLPALAGDLVDLRLDRLTVSCDSPVAETYLALRGLPLARLEAGLEALTRARRDRGTTLPNLQLEFVLQRRNLAELPAMPRFARRWEAVSLLVTNLLPHSPEMATQIVYDRPQGQVGKALWQGAARDWFTWGTVDLPRMAWGAGRRCRFVEGKAAVVGWDGKVTPCLALAHSYPCYVLGQPKRVTRWPLGDLGCASLGDIWMGEEYVRFRARVRWFRFPSCVDCGLGASCDYRARNLDCWGGDPSCADCLWAQDIVRCP